jgi:hypothetical protein
MATNSNNNKSSGLSIIAKSLKSIQNDSDSEIEETTKKSIIIDRSKFLSQDSDSEDSESDLGNKLSKSISFDDQKSSNENKRILTKKAIKNRERLEREKKKEKEKEKEKEQENKTELEFTIESNNFSFNSLDEINDNDYKIVIRSQERNSKKAIITISYIPKKYLNNNIIREDILSDIKKLGTRANFIESDNVIQTSGSTDKFINQLKEILRKRIGCDISNITIAGKNSR